jgi:hypothetical protein
MSKIFQWIWVFVLLAGSACTHSVPAEPASAAAPAVPRSAKDVIARSQSQIQLMRQRLQAVGSGLVSVSQKEAVSKLSESAAPHCGERNSNVTFIAEEQLRDPTAKPRFRLGLAEWCGGTNLADFLVWATQQREVETDSPYDDDAANKILDLPYLVVMRTAAYIPPRLIAKITAEAKTEAWKKEVCPSLDAQTCDQLVKRQIEQNRWLLQTGIQPSGTFSTGVVVEDFFLVELKSNHILGKTRMRVENDPEFQFEASEDGLTDERFAEALAGNLLKTTVDKAHQAIGEAFHLF